MAVQNIAQLKQWFRTNLYPTQQQFYDWFDSFRHKSDPIEMTAITGLVQQLQNINNNLGSGGSTPPIVVAGTNTAVIPAGTKINGLIVIDSDDALISLGTTNGDNDLIEDFACQPPYVDVDWTKYFVAEQNVFFTGMNPTTVIKIYRS